MSRRRGPLGYESVKPRTDFSINTTYSLPRNTAKPKILLQNVPLHTLKGS